jgi:hypothetical protein
MPVKHSTKPPALLEKLSASPSANLPVKPPVQLSTKLPVKFLAKLSVKKSAKPLAKLPAKQPVKPLAKSAFQTAYEAAKNCQ